MLVDEKFAPTVVSMVLNDVTFNNAELYCLSDNQCPDHVIQIELLKKTIKKFYTESPKDANCIARIVNKKHFQRVQNLLEEPLVEASIVHGGSLDEEKL